MADGIVPLTPLQQEAAEHHERYRAWLEAGFSPDQAMLLLTCRMGNQYYASHPPPTGLDD
jgi:hypothetical protein